MKSFVKFGIVPVLVFLSLLTMTFLLLPVLVDVQRFVPAVEHYITKQTGTRVDLGDDFSISFFPWVSLSSSNVIFKGPEDDTSSTGFTAASFEARIELLPLIQGNFIVSRLVIDGLDLTLQKKSTDSTKQLSTTDSLASYLTSEKLLSTLFSGKTRVGLLVITNGTIRWKDADKQLDHHLTDIMMVLDHGEHHELNVDIKTEIDGRSCSVEGNLGPFGGSRQWAVLPVNLLLNLDESGPLELKGKIKDLLQNPSLELDVSAVRLQPERLIRQYSRKTAPDGLPLSLIAKLVGSKESFEIKDGKAEWGTERSAFSTQGTRVDGKIERLNIQTDELSLAPKNEISQPSQTEKDVDRVNIILQLINSLPGEGQIEIARLHADKALLEDCKLTYKQTRKQQGEQQVDQLTLAPLSCRMAEGDITGSLVTSFGKKNAKANFSFELKKIHTSKIPIKLTQNAFLDTLVNGEGVLSCTADNWKKCRSTLGGYMNITGDNGVLHGLHFAQSPEVTTDSVKSDNRGISFTNVSGKLMVKGGRISSPDLTLVTETAPIRIDGYLDLQEQTANICLYSNTPNISTTSRISNISNAEKHTCPETDKSGEQGILASIKGELGHLNIYPDSNNSATSPGANEESSDQQEAIELVEEKLPPPADADVKNLVGKPLMDPAVVAQRIGLQREEKKATPAKVGTQVANSEKQPHRETTSTDQALSMQTTAGTGRIVIQPMEEKESRESWL